MLNLWRNIGERIVIGDEMAVLTVVSNLNGRAARVQIDAPQLFDDSPRIARIEVNEQYRLTDDIVIHVVEVERAGVRFQIQAPREISVDREEIYQEKKRRR